jgi:hypothetical protein
LSPGGLPGSRFLELLAPVLGNAGGTGAFCHWNISIPGKAMVHQTPSTSSSSQNRQQPELDLPLDVVSFIIVKAREFDVKVADNDPDSGSNSIDDGQTDVLADKADDPVREELVGAINGLRDDQQMRLVALAWLGRGTFDLDEWSQAVKTARDEHNNRTAEYLLGLPLLGDYLEDGLAMFGEGIVDDSDEREGVDSENAPLGNTPDKPTRQ